ncbi:hypothetical protein F4680DRAFT_421505 [Xylaria scruposa]|nr:hypothetical protein F4680DRAFT_421505 [Xylaria scruposa]
MNSLRLYIIATNNNLQVLFLLFTVAPTKVLIMLISSQVQFTPNTRKLFSWLRTLGIANNVDHSGTSIGKRYARNDELGTRLRMDLSPKENETLHLRSWVPRMKFCQQ